MSGRRGGAEAVSGALIVRCQLCQANCVSRHNHRLKPSVFRAVARLWPDAIKRLSKPLDEYAELHVCCKWLKDAHPHYISDYTAWLRPTAPLLDAPASADSARAARAGARALRAPQPPPAAAVATSVPDKRKGERTRGMRPREAHQRVARAHRAARLVAQDAAYLDAGRARRP